jgi:hypothetical protein
MIMGKEVVADDTRTIAVFLNNKPYESTTLTYLEGVSVALVPPTMQSVLQIHSDFIRFIDGKCINGQRILKKGEFEMIPSQSQQPSYPIEIEIQSTWAASYSSGVKFAAPHILTYHPQQSLPPSEL